VYAEVNPEDSLMGKTALVFKAKLEELTGGSVTIDLQASGSYWRGERCAGRYDRRHRCHRHHPHLRLQPNQLRHAKDQAAEHALHL
jgi:hypothetical protein